MGINTSNLCYTDDSASKQAVMTEVQQLLFLHTRSNKPNYIPVPDNGNCGNTMWNVFDENSTVFVSVKALSPAMLVAFQNYEKLGAKGVIAQLNGTVYDYAVNVIKELLVDDNSSIVYRAILLAREYRLCSMSLLPEYWQHRLNRMYQDLKVDDIKFCGKMLHDAIR